MTEPTHTYDEPTSYGMDKVRALDVLIRYNLWRRDRTDSQHIVMPEPKLIGEAIDFAIRELQNDESKPITAYDELIKIEWFNTRLMSRTGNDFTRNKTYLQSLSIDEFVYANPNVIANHLYNIGVVSIREAQQVLRFKL